MTKETTSKRKRFKGVVVSAAMQNTVVVRVDRYYRHSRYLKHVRQQKRFLADDPDNTAKPGQVVEIEETKPISKNKSFRVVQAGGQSTDSR